MSRKIALIVGNSKYRDKKLTQLMAPSSDIHALADLFSSTPICDFDEVISLSNKRETVVRRHIARLFEGKMQEDLLLLYFSGHGVRDDQGELYLAVKDTECDLLNGTAVAAGFITAAMDRCRSKRQVIILDCCHASAFIRGMKSAVGASVGTAAAFEGTGYGRVILTASDTTQYAFEGDQIIGKAENSVFTHFLIQGLRSGKADADADGKITIDELYDYVSSQMANITPKQTPGKYTFKQQGQIVIANNPFLTPMTFKLPVEMLQAVENPIAEVREGAVRALERLLYGSHKGRGLAAKAVLQRLAAEDDSHLVSTLAKEVLERYLKTQKIEPKLSDWCLK